MDWFKELLMSKDLRFNNKDSTNWDDTDPEIFYANRKLQKHITCDLKEKIKSNQLRRSTKRNLVSEDTIK